FAIIDALVGKVERREHADHLAEPLLRQRLGAATEQFEQLPACRRNKPRKILQVGLRLVQARAHRRRPRAQRAPNQRRQRQRVELSHKTHANQLNTRQRENQAWFFRERRKYRTWRTPCAQSCSKRYSARWGKLPRRLPFREQSSDRIGRELRLRLRR